MCDVVYKIGGRGKWNEDREELRYSIRSVEKNFQDLNRIVIVGKKPSWLKNVIHIDVDDAKEFSKDANIIKKLYHVSNDDLISSQFINISDDQIINNPTQTEDFTPRINNEVFTKIKDIRKISAWAYSLFNTISILRSQRLNTDCYETHIPTLINKQKFKKAVDKYGDFCFKYYGMCANTLYFNQIKATPKEMDSQVEFFDDKNKADCNIENVKLFGYSPNGLTKYLKDYIENEYPNKSKYEKY